MSKQKGCVIVSIADSGDDFGGIEEVTDREAYDIMEDAERLFSKSGIHISSNEDLYEACITPEGEVLGASTVGLSTSDPYEWDDEERPVYTFSVAVSEKARRKGIARALVESIDAGFPWDEVLLEGRVVNQYMGKLLASMGFGYHDADRYESREDEGAMWTDIDRSSGRGMFRPNPAKGPKLRYAVLKRYTNYSRGRGQVAIAVYVGRKKAGHIAAGVVRPERLSADCLTDLRRAQGDRPGIKAFMVSVSHVKEEFRSQGVGNFLYDSMLAELKLRLPHQAVALVPMDCVFGSGSTSSSAGRVWKSMARRRDRSTERAVLANPGQFTFETDCLHSDFDSITALKESAVKIKRATFKSKLAKGQWQKLEKRLGYDRYFPLSKDVLVGYYKSAYRGRPAVFMTYSGIEQVFTQAGGR